MKLWKYRPTNVKISKNIKVHVSIPSSPIFIFSVLSIKVTIIIHNWHMHKWINKFSSYFDTLLEKKISPILIGVEINRWRIGYTSSGDSGMERSLFRHIFLGFFSYMR